MLERVVIVGGARTPIGSFGKALASVPAAELGAVAARCALERSGADAQDIDEVIIGCVGQIGSDAYIARAVGIGAGLPVEVPAFTVNRLCGSGLEAINSAVRLIQTGGARAVLAGGAESMSRYPYVSAATRWGGRFGDVALEDGLGLVLRDPFSACHMGETAENVGSRWGVDRAAQDAFALESQRRAAAAIQSGRLAEEIVPVAIQERGGTRTMSVDEHPRPDTCIEGLSALRPVFRNGGDVTAGNSSGINDGAAAVVVMAESRAAELGLRPRLRVVAQAVAGVPPDVMGIGPIPAVKKLLARAAISIADIDLVELNEAFAAQAVACIRELDLDPSRVNVNGGAIAFGHPVGATGCILTVKLMYEMERRGSRLGLVTACIGGGQGIATLFQRV